MSRSLRLDRIEFPLKIGSKITITNIQQDMLKTKVQIESNNTIRSSSIHFGNHLTRFDKCCLAIETFVNKNKNIFILFLLNVHFLISIPRSTSVLLGNTCF
uniref:Uncharacterized protein n=1 Tax=Cacopsylla melanoneura TaxID=428564 RepID=A0A8D8XIQ3_9HEMI